MRFVKSIEFNVFKSRTVYSLETKLMFFPPIYFLYNLFMEISRLDDNIDMLKLMLFFQTSRTDNVEQN